MKNNGNKKISNSKVQKQPADFVAKLLFFCLLTFLICPAIFAQPKTDTTKNKSNVTLNLTLAFGPYKNASKVTAADMIKLLKTNPVLVLKDDKGISYPVVSFEFTWRQKMVADDAVTGKPKTSYTMVGQTMKGNKIDNDWTAELTGLLKAGEDINFSTIVYFDAKKNANYTSIAPSLAISIL